MGWLFRVRPQWGPPYQEEKQLKKKPPPPPQTKIKIQICPAPPPGSHFSRGRGADGARKGAAHGRRKISGHACMSGPCRASAAPTGTRQFLLSTDILCGLRHVSNVPISDMAPSHSITSSARASNVGDISRPSAFAVLRLITRSNFVGCSTGRSAGFAPRRILST